jgi:choline monooxygenase
MSSKPPDHRVVSESVASSWTLPAHLYVDPAVLEQEREQIFFRTWQLVGRRDQVASPGDYFTCDLLGEPLLIVRGADGCLRGFFNVCRHRAGPPATGCGSRKVFRCGYHGWTYGLDGTLLHAPGMDGTEDFSARDFGMRPVRTEEWGAWVFVNLDEECEPLLPALRDLPAQTARFSLDRLTFYQRREYVMACNWKVYVDNYLEGYHLPSVHPGLNRELDFNQYQTETFERHSRQWSPIRGPENAEDSPRRYAQAGGEDSAEYFWIFPGWMLNCYPDNISMNLVLPLGTEKTLAIFEWYLPPGAKDVAAAEAGVRFSDEIQREDGAICEVVHRNLRSRAYGRGRFSARQEIGVHHFHRLLGRYTGNQ